MLLSPEGIKKKKTQQSEAKSEEQEEKEKVSSPTVNTLVKLNLAKNRNGQTGEMILLFQKSYSQFSDLSQEQLERIRAMQEGHIEGDLNDIKPEGK